jgi:hypothetical protein
MNVTFIDYPVTAGLQLTGLAAPPSAALANQTAAAHRAALAAAGYPVMAANLAVTATGSRHRRRELLQTTGSFNVAVYGSSSAWSAGKMSSAVSSTTADTTPRGLVGQLSSAGTTVGGASLPTPPSVSVRMTVNAVYASGGLTGTAFAAAASALSSALPQALASLGVSGTVATAAHPPSPPLPPSPPPPPSPRPPPSIPREDGLSKGEERLVGGLLGGFVGFVLLAAVVLLWGRAHRKPVGEKAARMLAIPATAIDDGGNEGGYPVKKLDYYVVKQQPPAYEVLAYRPVQLRTPARSGGAGAAAARTPAARSPASGAAYEPASYRGTHSNYSPRKKHITGPAYAEFYE